MACGICLLGAEPGPSVPGVGWVLLFQDQPGPQRPLTFGFPQVRRLDISRSSTVWTPRLVLASRSRPVSAGTSPQSGCWAHLG